MEGKLPPPITLKGSLCLALNSYLMKEIKVSGRIARMEKPIHEPDKDMRPGKRPRLQGRDH